jgi:hypothetical protein
MLTRLRVRWATPIPDADEPAGFCSRLSRRRLEAVPAVAVEPRLWCAAGPSALPMEKGASRCCRCCCCWPSLFSFSSIPSNVACHGRFLLLLVFPPLAAAAVSLLALPASHCSAPAAEAIDLPFPLSPWASSVARRVE